MAEPVCSDCWRRDNLTVAQRLDPAYNRPRSQWLCPEHWAERHLTEER
ncbi:hypothetical protein [Nocardia brasiliensis]|nr:hypothetical protein [Nocardia brasiliensis]